MSLQQFMRSAGLGKLAYRCWYRPRSRVREILAAGGLREVRRTELGRREMEASAYKLTPLTPTDPAEPLELHLLTGRRFWYQTAFCLWSFARASRRRLAPVIYDDGTLTTEWQAPIARLFPLTQFVPQADIVSRLDEHLPAAQFPFLRERWRNYPNLRKLTDVHVGRTGWKLVLDSDLLFFHRPQFLLDWLARPEMPLHAVDCETSYGYPLALMSELAGKPISELVNVGLTGLDGSSLDWERLEYWCRTLIERHGTHYYLEQALIAMLIAGQNCAVATSDEYVTKPDENEARDCRAVMHHYVATSKKWYFRHCWRMAVGEHRQSRNSRL